MEPSTLAWLSGGATALGVSLDEARLKSLDAFLAELVRWGQRMNLTASLANEQLVDHTLDSLALVPHVPESGTVIDVGSGGGFPGLPLAILRPALRLTLVDSTAKKCAFLGSAARSAGLANVKVVNARAETLPLGQFDVAVSRAAMSPEAWFALGSTLIRPGGLLVMMLQGASTYSLSEAKRIPYRLPSGAAHALLTWRRPAE